MVPVVTRRQSARVLLPWSMCAMMLSETETRTSSYQRSRGGGVKTGGGGGGSTFREKLAEVGIVKSDQQANHYVLQRFSSDYALDKKLLQHAPKLTLTQIEDPVRATHRELEESRNAVAGSAHVRSRLAGPGFFPRRVTTRATGVAQGRTALKARLHGRLSGEGGLLGGRWLKRAWPAGPAVVFAWWHAFVLARWCPSRLQELIVQGTLVDLRLFGPQRG